MQKSDSFSALPESVAKTSASSPVWVLCDFDGTISVRDVEVALLNRFATPGWREREKAIIAAGYKSARYLPAIFAGWSASREEMLQFIEKEAALDPHFPRFVSYCRQAGYHLEIVSDGLNLYIEYLLGKNRLDDIPFTCNYIQFHSEGVTLHFPNRSDFCGKCGNCKKQRVLAARQANARCVVYIGDGISDECPAEVSDIVFAKGSLWAYCQKQGLPAIPFQNFADVLASFPAAIERCQAPAGKKEQAAPKGGTGV